VPVRPGPWLIGAREEWLIAYRVAQTRSQAEQKQDHPGKSDIPYLIAVVAQADLDWTQNCEQFAASLDRSRSQRRQLRSVRSCQNPTFKEHFGHGRKVTEPATRRPEQPVILDERKPALGWPM
jgi:hypothetical protein